MFWNFFGRGQHYKPWDHDGGHNHGSGKDRDDGGHKYGRKRDHDHDKDRDDCDDGNGWDDYQKGGHAKDRDDKFDHGHDAHGKGHGYGHDKHKGCKPEDENRPPTIEGEDEALIIQGSTDAFIFFEVSDPDDDDLEVTLSGPDAHRFQFVNGGLAPLEEFTNTPDSADGDFRYEVTITVTDGLLTDSIEFSGSLVTSA